MAITVTVGLQDGWEIHLDDEGPEVWFWLYAPDSTPVFCWVVEGTVWENMSFEDDSVPIGDARRCEPREIPPFVREEYFFILRCYNWNQCHCCAGRFEGDNGLGEICTKCGWEVDILEATTEGWSSTANHTTLDTWRKKYLALKHHDLLMKRRMRRLGHTPTKEIA